MGAHSRNKGAAFELRIAAKLLGLTGITFKRNLVQTQEAEHSDLVPSDPAWPFAMELKARKDGNGCETAWRAQAVAAARKSGKIPAVIYKYDYRDIMVSVPLDILGRDMPGRWAEVTFETFAYLAAEIMAERASLEH